MTPHSPDSRSSLAAELRRWVDAGLIHDDQAEAISRYEGKRTSTQSSGRAARAVALLGALTLVCGVGSLVAYNWGRFGSTPKLLGMAAMLAVALGATLRSRQKQITPVSTALEVSLLVSSGLTLGGLALVSQVYNQDGELWQLLFFWCALTTPLMSFSRSRFAHILWYVALAGSLVSSGDAGRALFESALPFDRESSEMAVVIVYGALSVIFCARLAASRFQGRAQAGLLLLHIQLVLMGLFGGLFWFDEGGSPLLWLLGIVSIAAIFIATPNTIERIGFGNRLQAVGLLMGAIVLAVLPMGFSTESGVAAFIAFVIFWAAAWRLAEMAGHVNNARLAVAALGVRIVFASFELFESLLFTGAVLIGMGAAALVWSRFKWNAQHEEAHHE